jgi:hypothetical protein
MPTTKVSRLREKQVLDRARLDQVLDAVKIAHVAVAGGDEFPLVVPTAFARDGDAVIVHGSTGSGWMRRAATGASACLTVTALDGVVVARSVFESSFHYRSAVLFGTFTALTGDDKNRALDVVVEKLIPGRGAEVRPSTRTELNRTMVLTMPIEQWSLKVSDRWPEDPPEDVAGPAWAGVVPLQERSARPIPAPDLRDGIDIPLSVARLTKSIRPRR